MIGDGIQTDQVCLSWWQRTSAERQFLHDAIALEELKLAYPTGCRAPCREHYKFRLGQIVMIKEQDFAGMYAGKLGIITAHLVQESSETESEEPNSSPAYRVFLIEKDDEEYVLVLEECVEELDEARIINFLEREPRLWQYFAFYVMEDWRKRHRPLPKLSVKESPKRKKSKTAVRVEVSRASSSASYSGKQKAVTHKRKKDELRQKKSVERKTEMKRQEETSEPKKHSKKAFKKAVHYA